MSSFAGDPLRVCFDGRFIADRYPGVGRYAFELIRAMAKLDEMELSVLYDPRAANSRFELEHLEGGASALVELRCDPRSLINQCVGPAVIRRQRADLYHSPFLTVPLGRTGPRVITIHDLLPVQWPQSVLAPVWRPLLPLVLRRTIRSADMILVPSDATATALVSWLGWVSNAPVNAVPIRTVPYAARDDVFFRRSPEEIDRLRQSLSLPRRYILCVGSRRPHKNLGTLVSAWEGVESRVREDLRLVIAGVAAGGHDQNHGGHPLIDWLGEVAEPDLPALYSGAEVFVMPSAGEGFGLPVLEAMSCGTPVVCSRGGALSEVAGDAAELFSPDDVAALTALLSGVLESPERRRRLAAGGPVRAAQFSWRRTAAQTVAAYQDLLGR